MKILCTKLKHNEMGNTEQIFTAMNNDDEE